MRLREVQIERYCRTLFEGLKEKKLLVPKAEESAIIKRMMEIVVADLRKEEELNREVEKLLDFAEKQSSVLIDRRKMYSMIKRKLAKEKGIVL